MTPFLLGAKCSLVGMVGWGYTGLIAGPHRPLCASVLAPSRLANRLATQSRIPVKCLDVRLDGPFKNRRRLPRRASLLYSVYSAEAIEPGSSCSLTGLGTGSQFTALLPLVGLSLQVKEGSFGLDRVSILTESQVRPFSTPQRARAF